MDLHTGAVPGDEAVPEGRMKRWMEVTLREGSPEGVSRRH